MRRGKCIFVRVVIAMFLAGLVIPVATRAETATVKVGGAGVGLGVMHQLAKVFGKTHPGVRIQVVSSLGSAGGIKALVAGSLDIAISARQPNGAEMAKGVLAQEIARSPFVFIVNRKVNKEGITPRELENILSGQTNVWPDGTRVRPVLRPETETCTKIVRGLSPAMNRAVSLAMAREGMIHAVTDQENVDIVEKTSGSLGASSLTQLYSEKRQVRILSLNGIRPDVKALADGSYPLFIPLYLVTTPAVTAAARTFVEFIHSGEGSAILAANGNLAIRIKRDAR